MQTPGRSSRIAPACAIRTAGLALLIIAVSPRAGHGAELIAPQAMRAIGTVDTRFQSYNVEMVEVTGGRF